MAASTASSDEEITGINVTPFVDICLVLLVIFMVTAKYMVSQSIPVDLPEAASASSTQSNDTVNITLDANGNYFLDTTPIDENTLREQVRRRAREQPETRAVLNADQSIAHGRVTHLIDLVRLAGITRFAIQTTTPVQP